jgi:prepilin-type processing-associated H-X9-DG protein
VVRVGKELEVVELMDGRCISGYIRMARVLNVWLADGHCERSHGNIHKNRLVGDGPNQRVAAGSVGYENDDRLRLHILFVIH